MDRQIEGIHHVTAIARDPQANVDFYAGVLGLRLVKKTINFDDPGTYHFYYGDEQGRPGTIITFFPWPMARRGSHGAGQATVTSFSVPEGSLGWWSERLERLGVAAEAPRERFDEEVLTLLDPDGLKLELIARADDPRAPWERGPVPADKAVRGFDGVTLTEWNPEVTVGLLTGFMGFRQVGESGGRFRFEVGAGGPGTRVDVLARPDAPRGHVSAGTVHHVAWRVADDEQQRAWHEELNELGLHVSPILDRQYFHSIYFREPGGVLFEIATDPPGFTFDETVEDLGSGLR
ncbi:MAG TPA: ring-cleaving dioxygenase, partial [Thermoanaerobaculia bacterium]